MTDIKTPADDIKEMRELLAVLAREVKNRGAVELVDIVERCDEIAEGLLRLGTN